MQPGKRPVLLVIDYREEGKEIACERSFESRRLEIQGVYLLRADGTIPARGRRIGSELRRKKLQSDMRAQGLVLRLVNHTHTPAAKSVQYAVVGDALPDHGRLEDEITGWRGMLCGAALPVNRRQARPRSVARHCGAQLQGKEDRAKIARDYSVVLMNPIGFLRWTLPLPAGTVGMSSSLHEADCKRRCCEL